MSTTTAADFEVHTVCITKRDEPYSLTDDAHREMAIRALSHEMQVVMACWALRGYHFVYFGDNGMNRRWKALDYNRPAGQREVHTASTLYVLLSALGDPK